jgi:hypothetical protein
VVDVDGGWCGAGLGGQECVRTALGQRHHPGLGERRPVVPDPAYPDSPALAGVSGRSTSNPSIQSPWPQIKTPRPQPGHAATPGTQPTTKINLGYVALGSGWADTGGTGSVS